MRTFITCILCFLFCIINGFGQPTETRLVSRFTQNEGLSSYNIHNIVQDPAGFTWIATQDGLNLFDGKTFTKYTINSEKSKKISGSDVRCVTLDKKRGVIWVLSSYGDINGINCRTDEVVKTYNNAANDNDDWCSAMTLAGNRLWVGSMTGIKLFNLDTEKWETSISIPFKKNKIDDLLAVKNIYTDDKGNVWALIDHYGILVIDQHSKKIIGRIDNSELVGGKAADLMFTSIANNSGGSLLIGTSFGLRQIVYEAGGIKINKHLNSQLQFLSEGKIGSIIRATGYVYIANSNHLYRYDDKLSVCTTISESNFSNSESWLNDIHSMYVDDEQNLWMGCKQGLAFMPFYRPAFENFNNKSFNQSGLNHVYNLLPLDNGDILVALENGLLKYEAAANRFKPINKVNMFNFLFLDFEKKVILSGDNGLYVLKNEVLSPASNTYPELKPIVNCHINSCVNIADSVYVLGSENNRGIFLWNYRKRTLKIINNASSPVKLRSNIVNKVFKDSKNRIWVLSDFGIDIISADFLKVENVNFNNPVSGEKIKLYFDMCEAEGKFWIACYSYGIIETDFDNKLIKLVNTNQGLSNDGVYKIFAENNHRLLITSNNGLSVLNTVNMSFFNYYEQDGLHSNEFEENCGIKKDGKIYVGGLYGFSIVHPDMFYFNKKPPRLYFTNIQIDTRSAKIHVKDLEIKKVTIPNNALQTTVSFSALNYGNPGRVAYKYKIEELDSKWIDLGRQNFIDLIGLNPGTYNMLVKASNENGVWNPAPIRLALVFLPKWYQTWWFKLLVFAAACGVVYAIYAYRIKQLKAQQRIRREIANDLHDDLGSSLNSIKMFTHMAIEKKENGSYLGEIEKLITHTAAGLRDMLWVLEDSRDTLDALVDRIKKFAEPVANANNVVIEYQLDAAISKRQLSKTEKRNLLLIVKEALNNSFKYAGCSRITIKIADGDYKISLSIKDDGKGFDMQNQSAGYGLNNIKYRVEQIGYQHQVDSSPQNGTSVFIWKK